MSVPTPIANRLRAFIEEDLERTGLGPEFDALDLRYATAMFYGRPYPDSSLHAPETGVGAHSLTPVGEDR